MAAIQKGDIVRYLNSTGGGTVVRIEGQLAYVEDEDGFETPALIKECVVVAHNGEKPSTDKFVEIPKPGKKETKAPGPAVVRAEDIFPESEETPEGEKISAILAYEPREIKHLQTTTFDAYLVNDSNYYLLFAYMTRPDSCDWTIRYAGRIEPGIQLYLGEVKREDLPQMDRVALQYVAYKEGREFKLKSPGAIETRLDTTKFCRLHCFHENEYFTTPVIAVEIVKRDVLQRSMAIDSSTLEDVMRAKKASDIPRRQPILRKEKKSDPNAPLVVDLHIAELIDDLRGLSNSDMLNKQIDEFRKVMDENLKNHGKKIIFIHGKGEGVLRQAILKELKYRYKEHKYQDASFREYGYGATQITIK